MKRVCFVLALLMLCMVCAGSMAEGVIPMKEEIITITGEDGVSFDGKLRLPMEGEPKKLVIYVNGSGPNTYDNHREVNGVPFDYFQLFADEFVARGVAFFSYNTRGVTAGNEPPYFAEIDEAGYQTYIPSNEVTDVEQIIETLTARPELEGTKVYLLGWSAGAIIAPQVALRGKAQVDALLLAGYPNETMADILNWQQTGGASMVFYRQYFPSEEDGSITKEAFEADANGIAAALGAKFADIDVNSDGRLTEEDFAIMLAQNREQVFSAFENGDDAWLRDNYGVHLTSAWYLDYANFPPNSEVLPQLDLPIYIFQGRFDGNTPATSAEAIAETFSELGKSNLTVSIFEQADHDLNYLETVLYGSMPDGLAAIFETVEQLDTE